jgi:uncharacterized membrane protein YagU involved in acid resistance
VRSGPLKDAAAGAFGGIAASALMTLAGRAMMSGAVKAGTSPEELEAKAVQSPEGEAPTEKVAATIAEQTTGRRLDSQSKEHGGHLVHYAFGAVLGALYGLLSSRFPRIRAGSGTAYGAAVWVGATETALPLSGLSKPPGEFPFYIHAMALASHVVFGASLDRVTRWARERL